MEEKDVENVNVNETSVDEKNPTSEVEENEEVVGTLTDTSEESEDDTSKSEEETEKVSVEDEKRFTQKEVDKMIEARVGRLESNNRKKLQEYEELINTLKVGTGVERDISVSELNKKFKGFYKEQGVDIPEYVDRGRTEREEKILAKADAQDIIDAGIEEINRVAAEIYNKPVDKRTIREKIIYTALGEHIMKEKAINELKSKGADTKILEDNNFKTFAGKFSVQTPIGEIYDMYQKINTKTEEVKKIPPASTGSVKTTGTTSEIKDYYTPEEVAKFSMDELKNNPRLMKAVDSSMQKWK